MQLTLYRTLCIHTLLLVGLGGYVVEHRRGLTQNVPVKHVRMPTLEELLEIEHLGAELRSQGARQVGGLYVESKDLPQRYRALIDLELRYMPPEHPEVVYNRRELARCLKRLRQYAESVEQYEILMNVFQRVMGADDPMTLECKGEFSDSLVRVKESQKEEERLSETYKTQSIILGKDHIKVLQIQGEIAAKLMEQSKYREAENALRTVCNLQMKTKEGADHWAGVNLAKLVMCLVDQGKRKDALEWVQELEWFLADSVKKSVWWSECVASLHADIETGRNKRRVKRE